MSLSGDKGVAQFKKSVKMGHPSTDINVKREGKFTQSGYDVLDEAYVYNGDENTLIMTQSYTHEFQCVYQLESYPFDTQVRFFGIFSLMHLCC